MEIINVLKEEEKKLAFSDETETCCIGHLRCDFGSGNEFWTTWWPHAEKLNDREFKADLDEVINVMREWTLKNRRECKRYCEENLKRTFGDRGYGMRVNSRKYAYVFRLNPMPGDYDIYCYCYLRDGLSSH